MSPFVCEWSKSRLYIFLVSLSSTNLQFRTMSKGKREQRWPNLLQKKKQARIHARFWSQNIYPAILCIVTKCLCATHYAQGTVLGIGEPLSSLVWHLFKNYNTPHFIMLCRCWVFYKISSLWQPCVEQFYRHNFYNSICLSCVFVSHFVNFWNISNFLIITVFVVVTRVQWSLMLLL